MTNAARPSNLDPKIASRLKRDADGLVPAVAQQYDTGEVLMVGWMDDEALHPRGVAREGAADHPGPGVGPAFPEHHVRREVPGLPASAERGRVGAGPFEKCREREALIQRVGHSEIVGCCPPGARPPRTARTENP